MTPTRFSLLAIGFASLLLGCNPKDEPQEPVVLTLDGTTIDAETAFYQPSLITNALGLEPRNPDGMLMLSFGTDPSYIQYEYPSKGLDNPTPYLSAATGTVPAGTASTDFHLEFPMTVGQALPEAVLDVQSARISGAVTFSLTLDPDFPYTEARIDHAVITLPSWVQEEYASNLDGQRLEWPFSETIHPGEVNEFTIYCSVHYTPEEGEGLREPGHRLVLDASMTLDGTLSVDESRRKNPKEAPAPWSATFLSWFSTEICPVRSVTGRMDLSGKMGDRSLTFSEIPPFLGDAETVLDLDDLHGELIVLNDAPAPMAISGVLRGDDREYPFSYASLPATDEETFRLLLSEKGGRTREGGEAGHYDIPVKGLSGLVDSDPVSFAIKDVRIANDPDTPCELFFDRKYTTLVQASFSSPLMIGKDFRVRHFVDLELLNTWDPVVRIDGTYTVENTLPFDYEIRPVFYEWKDVLPITAEPVRIPAGSRESPSVQTVSFDWAVDAHITDLALELKGHTASGREGEVLYKDQHVAVRNIKLEVQYGTKN